MANRPQGFEDCVKNTRWKVMKVEFHGIWVKSMVKSLSSPPANIGPYWALPTHGEQLKSRFSASDLTSKLGRLGLVV